MAFDVVVNFFTGLQNVGKLRRRELYNLLNLAHGGVVCYNFLVYYFQLFKIGPANALRKLFVN